MKIERHQRLKQKEIFLDEALLATQNRYLGVRACFEEGLNKGHRSIRGTYINGIYDTHEIKYEEKAFGFPSTGEGIVNLPDAQTIYIKVGQTIISPSTCEIIDLKRYFYLDKGYTERCITYQTPEGYQFTFTYKRIASLRHKELFMIDASVSTTNYKGPITVLSILNGDVSNDVDLSDPRLASSDGHKLNIQSFDIANHYGSMTVQTKHTHIPVSVMMTHNVQFDYYQDYKQIIGEKTYHIAPKKPVNFTKYALYFNGLDHPNINQAMMLLYKRLDTIDLYKEQSHEISEFWAFSNIEITDKSNPNLGDAIHYNLYQLFTSGSGNPRYNIPAKGLTGEGYEGHTFWDTEIYMLPFFMQVNPDLAKSLLDNRYGQIDNARDEAKYLGINKGIKFAWRTISGKETSPYFLAGQAQYHINSDIAYAFIKYYQLHGDKNFFIDHGLPVLLETSRFFSEIAVKKNHTYHIYNVTGPDEYTTMVNDNYYTNSMIQYQLAFLVKFIETHGKDLFEVLERLHVSDQEIQHFKDLSDHMYLPYDNALNIDAQDDDFLNKDIWPFDQTSDRQYPLLLHFHPLKIYRHQVLKQADTILSHTLLENRPIDIMQDSFNYYEKITTHDSSLSRCIHARQAARLGYIEKAYQYFLDTVFLDLNNVQKNTEYGLHVANLGGIYNTILYGFIGFKIDEHICLKPSLPKDIDYIKLNIRLNQSNVLKVHVTHEDLHVSTNEPVDIHIYDQMVHIEKNYTVHLR